MDWTYLACVVVRILQSSHTVTLPWLCPTFSLFTPDISLHKCVLFSLIHLLSFPLVWMTFFVKIEVLCCPQNGLSLYHQSPWSSLSLQMLVYSDLVSFGLICLELKHIYLTCYNFYLLIRSLLCVLIVLVLPCFRVTFWLSPSLLHDSYGHIPPPSPARHTRTQDRWRHTWLPSYSVVQCDSPTANHNCISCVGNAWRWSVHSVE